MFTCPNCQTQNESGSRFCISCGHDLSNEVVGGGTVITNTGFYRRHLAVSTAQVMLALLLIWLLRSIFVNLSFVEGLTLPEVPFTAAQIITFIAYLVAFVLLLNFVSNLRTYWPNAYPHLAFLTPALTVIIYLVLISLAYRALLPVILDLVDDPGDFVLVLRVLLTVLALILLAWAGKIVYDALPGWLSGIHFGTTQGEIDDIACLNCGRIQTAALQTCAHCGHALTSQGAINP